MKTEEKIKRMTIEEKVGQLSQNLFGWKSYADNGSTTTNYLEKEVNKYGNLGFIYGVLRSDPWSQVSHDNGVKQGQEKKLLDKITSLAQGKEEIPPFFVEEASHGHQGLNSTLFPVNLAMGCTFNKHLYKESCASVAHELSYKGVNIALLSAFDLALDPRWGRSEECFGEDTYLAKEFIKYGIEGFQGLDTNIPAHKVGVVVKHMIAQGSSIGGYNGKSVSIGENELNNHHMPLVEEAANSNAIGVMAAYNDIDGVPCHSNQDLLINKLRKQMKFDGFVMSDGCAIDNLLDYVATDEEAVAMAFKNGVNVDLWNKTFNAMLSAFKKKLISEEEIDNSLRIILNAKSRLNLTSRNKQEIPSPDFKENNEVSLQAARESIVLLKNDSILPMKSIGNSCLIGPAIDNVYHLLGDYTPFIKGKQSLKDYFNIPSAKGCDFRSSDAALIKESVEVAKKSETVILALGGTSARDFSVKFDRNGAAISSGDSVMDCGEGADIAEVKISAPQQELFDEIYKVNQNIIVIINSGRAIGIEEISKKAKAIIYSFYGGPNIPQALKETLVGENNPSGRLSVSIPKTSAHLPVYYWKKEVGKYMDMDEKPLYTFGDGISYSDIEISDEKISEIEASFTIKNKSDRDAKRTVLIFAEMMGTVIKPPQRILVAFDKFDIKANSSSNQKITLDLEWIKRRYKYKTVTFKIS